ncbi:hypothetical protein [Chryseobacterium paridis]|uniref:Glycosyltransferase n=1 Tax=Chryseobacterium paridis TaxID=2800328 RepID=A0ABS1FZV7_9FLAO|nr:hypothetical protein [Chryseobacterium paridis]MBK1897724.1 hypothetical protein [Chryseobacterium paridis]
MIDKKGKKLIIYDSLDFFIPYMESENIDVFRLYRKRDFLVSSLKKIFLKLDLFAPFWYEKWIRNIVLYNEIIIFATKDYTFIRKIKKRNPNIKIVFWYWNPAFRMGIPRKEIYSLTDLWSFDEKDCEQYKMKFNTTFYFNSIVLPTKQIKYDCIFLGINKGRRRYLEEVNATLNNLNIKSFFHIVPDKGENNPNNIKTIPYKDYLELVSESKCIIDILPEGQTGQTLRPMESIFFEKKLITNDRSIRDELFFDEQNIFILGENNISEIVAFIESPYKKIESDVVNYYDFTNWLKRFESNE